jgi:hypothetical protein
MINGVKLFKKRGKKMKKLMIFIFVPMLILLTAGSSLAWHRSPHVRFGIVIGPPPIWIAPPAIIYREYYPPVYYYYPPEDYYPPPLPPCYSSRAKVKVEITSVPENCELEVNGVYQGLTPLSIELPQGVPAVIRLSKAGYIPWEKTILPRSDMSLSPELEKKSH